MRRMLGGLAIASLWSFSAFGAIPNEFDRSKLPEKLQEFGKFIDQVITSAFSEDEWYKNFNLEFPADGNEVGERLDQWSVKSGIAFGHTKWSKSSPVGLELKVNLKSEVEFDRPKKDRVRVKVVVGEEGFRLNTDMLPSGEGSIGLIQHVSRKYCDEFNPDGPIDEYWEDLACAGLKGIANIKDLYRYVRGLKGFVLELAKVEIEFLDKEIDELKHQSKDGSDLSYTLEDKRDERIKARQFVRYFEAMKWSFSEKDQSFTVVYPKGETPNELIEEGEIRIGQAFLTIGAKYVAIKEGSEFYFYGPKKRRFTKESYEEELQDLYEDANELLSDPERQQVFAMTVRFALGWIKNEIAATE